MMGEREEEVDVAVEYSVMVLNMKPTRAMRCRGFRGSCIELREMLSRRIIVYLLAIGHWLS